MATALTSQQILSIAEEVGLGALDKVVASSVKVLLILSPNASQADIVGSIKRILRGKIGVLDDFIWPFLEPYVAAEVASAMAPAASTVTILPASGAINTTLSG